VGFEITPLCRNLLEKFSSLQAHVENEGDNLFEQSFITLTKNSFLYHYKRYPAFFSNGDVIDK